MAKIVQAKEVTLYLDGQEIDLSDPPHFDLLEPRPSDLYLYGYRGKIEIKITAWYMDIPKLIWTNVLSACNFWRN